MSNTRLYFKTAVIRDESEFLCLTDMWRAAGAADGKRPSRWLETEAAKDFISYVKSDVAKNDIEILRAEKGGGGGSGATWAHWQLGLAYAKYLSPEFHAWCNDVVRAVMQGHAPAVPAAELAQALDLAREAFAFARDVARRLDFIERHVATGGQIPAPRFAELRGLVHGVATAMVQVKQRPTERAARAAVWTRLRDQLGWGGSGQPWSAMPAQLEPAARALLRSMQRDAARTGSDDGRQLSLVKSR